MFNITERQGLIVYINNSHVLRKLRHYGHILYVSKKMHYVVLYVNRSMAEDIKQQLLELHNVTDVQNSQWPNIDPNVFRLSDEEEIAKKNNEEDN